MSQGLFASKVVIVEEEPKVRGIPSAPTSVAGAVGVTDEGPFNRAVLCTSFDEYQTTFGDFTADSDLALAAMGFFENGGNRLWVSRVGATDLAASTEISMTGEPDALSASVTSTIGPPYTVSQGDQLVVTVGVAPSESTLTITFQAYPATIITLPGPYALVDGQSLDLRVDGLFRSVTFTSGQFANIGAATVSEVGAAISAAIPEVQCSEEFDALVLQTVSMGLNSTLDVLGGTSLSVFGIDAGTSVQGNGNVHALDFVTFDDVVTAASYQNYDFYFDMEDVGGGIKLTTITTGADAKIQVTGGAAAAILGFDSDPHVGVAGTVATVPILHFDARTPGGDGNQLSVEITSPTGYDLRLFTLNVHHGSDIVESFGTLSRDPANARFIETVMNDPDTGSHYLSVTNVNNFRRIHPDYGTYALTGGAGGVPGDADFVGDAAARTGLHALDNVQDLSLLLVPGRTSPAVHNAMLTYCDEYRDGSVFAILDPPAVTSAADMVTYVSTTASLENASEHGAIYWPRVKILNPKKSVFGSNDQIVVPPSGIIAGVYARNDGARPGGVYRSPAGIEAGRMFGVLDFETDEALDERKRDLVYPHRINPLTTEPGLPKYIDGSRTLKGVGSFPFIGERRGITFIEQSLRAGLAFARHQVNTPDLRAQVRRTITAFLITQMNNGAFKSKDPATAFFVDVSDQLNTPSVVASGKVVARVGVATNKPTEFVVLEISQDTGALDEELAG